MTVEARSTPTRPRGEWPIVIFAILAWLALNVLALGLSGGVLPFDRPSLKGLPYAIQFALPSVGLIEISVLMAIVWGLTRRRPRLDIAARAPERALAARETALVLGWAAVGQAGGWVVGPLLGGRAFSFHLAGTLVGCAIPPTPREALVWAAYNFVVFALAPYLVFRRRYSATALNLRSASPRGDLIVILVIGFVETLSELAAFPAVFRMTPHQFAIAGPLAFLIYGLGTVLPTMILIYCILIPRYLRLTGSFAATVLLGGVTYAAMHLVEGWSDFATPRDVALSLVFVLLTYLGPGMFKAYVTLRTGNAWIHAIAYHAVAPHVVVDAPLIARIFAIR